MDGEVVAPGALREALADPDARDHFVDLLVIRGGVGSLGPPAWSASTSAWAGRRWWVAAAVLVLGVASGFIAGQRTVDARVAAGVETVVESSPSRDGAGRLEGAIAAPKPTRTISLQPGINWTERTGGQ